MWSELLTINEIQAIILFFFYKLLYFKLILFTDLKERKEGLP